MENLINALNLSYLGKTFHKRVLQESIDLCNKVNPIEDLRVAIEACLCLSNSKQYFNPQVVADYVAEFNLLSGLLKILGWENFQIVLGVLVKHALQYEFVRSNIDHRIYYIEFEGDEEVCAILNNEFSKFLGDPQDDNDNYVLAKIQIPTALQIPEYLTDAFNADAIYIFCDNIEKYYPEWLELDSKSLNDVYANQLKYIGTPDSNGIVEVAAVLCLTELVSAIYIQKQGYDKLSTMKYGNAFRDYARSGNIILE